MRKMIQFAKYGAVPALYLVASAAHAELPASIDTAMAGVQNDALALAGKVWPYMLAVAGATIALKLGKKFIGKIG